MKKSLLKKPAFFIFILAMGWQFQPAFSQNYLWDGVNVTAGVVEGGSGNWDSVNPNWVNSLDDLNVVWPGTAQAIFDGDGTGGAVSVIGSQSVSGLQFKTSNYLLNGSGSLDITAAGATITVDTGSATLQLPLAGTGLLIKSGAGALILDGENTYSGGTAIATGILQIGSGATSGTLGSGAVLNNASLIFSRSDIVTTGNNISGNGTVEFAGSGTTILTGNNSYAGVTTISAGVVQMGDGNAIGTLGAGNVSNNGILIFDRSDDVIIANEISGTGAIEQAGAGKTILTGNNTYDGTTTISAGILQIGNGGATGSLGAGNVNNETSLIFNRLNAFIVSNVISGSGSVRQIGAGTTTFTATNSYTGDTFVEAGALILNANAGNAVVGDIVISGGTLELAQADQIGDAVSVMVNSGSFQSNNQSDAMADLELHSSTLSTLSGLTITNELIVTAGTHDAAIDNGTLTTTTALLSGNSILRLTANIGNSTWSIGSGGLMLNDAAIQFGASGMAAQTALLNLNGDMTASGNNAFTVGSGLPTSILDLQGGVRTLNIIDGTTQVAPGIRNGGLTKTGDGELVLSGVSTYTGATNVNAGELVVNGGLASTPTTVAAGATLSGAGSIAGVVTITDGGILSPGQNGAGTFTVGSLILNDASRVIFDLLGAPSSGSPAGTDNDQIAVINALTLNGIFDLNTDADFTTGIYTLFTHGGALTGSGTDVVFGSAPAGYNLTLDTSSAGLVNLVVNYDGLQFWDGGDTGPDNVVDGGNGVWNATNNNWTNDSGNANNPWAVPDSGLVAVFKTTPGVVSVVGSQSISGLHFAEVSGYTLVDGGNGELNIVASGAELRIDPGLTATLEVPLTGAGGITKTGGGTIVLDGVNTYLGGTTITGGVLEISNDGNLGADGGAGIGDVLINNATLRTTGSFASSRATTISNVSTFETATGTVLAWNGQMTGSGQLNKAGDGTLILAGNNTYSGGTNIAAGVLQISSDLNLGNTTGHVAIQNATLRTTENLSSERTATLVGGAVFETLGATTLTWNGEITGAGNLQKTGEGTMIVSGPLHYTGNTIVSAGNLEFVSSTASLTGGIQNAATVTFNQTSDSSFQQTISGTGNLIKNNTHLLDLTSASLIYSGKTTVNAGILATSNITNSEVFLQGGSFSPGGMNHGQAITVKGLALQGGHLLYDIGNGGTDHITALGGQATLEAPTTFDFNNTGVVNKTHLLMNGLQPGGWSLAQLDYTGLNLKQGTFLLSADGTALYFSAYVGGYWSGSVLQNSAPVGTPTLAEFLVQGAVHTGTSTESNTVNSLTFDPNSSLLVRNNLTVTSGNFEVRSGEVKLNGGNILVPGDFSKRGSGALVTDSYYKIEGGSAKIEEGALYLNGTFEADSVEVSSGAVLGGNGLLIGDLYNGGTFEAGEHKVGTFTIHGDYTQLDDANMILEVAGLSTFDRLVINGAVNLDGRLDVMSLDHRFAYGQQFRFIQSDGIHGTFDEIIMEDPTRFRGRFVASNGIGSLLIAPASYTLVAETPNQRSLARGLDQWMGQEDGDIGKVTLALDQLSADEYATAFEAIMPGYYEAALSIGIELSHSQSQMLNQHFSSRRLGQRALEADRQVAPKPPLSEKGVQPVVHPAIKEQSWNVWTQGSGTLSRSGMNAASDEDFKSGTFMVGADYHVNRHFSVGLFGGYQEGSGDYANGGKIDLERILFGGTASLDYRGLYLNAALGGSKGSYDVKRPVKWRTMDRLANGSADTTELFANLGGGYDVQIGKWSFGPSFSAQYTRQGFESFSERGAGVLNMQLEDVYTNSLRSYLGGRVAYTIDVSENVAIIPELRIFWRHEFLQDSENIGVSLDGGNGPAFNYATSSADRDAINLGLGIGFQLGPNFYASIYYNADFTSSEVNHMISVSADLKF